MADFDPAAQTNYNSMQQQAGLLPPVFQPPPIPFPGQVSAAMAQGGPAAVSFLTAPASGPGFAGNTSAQFSPMAAQMAMGGGTGGFMTQGSVGTSFGAGMFPGQQLQGFTNQMPMFQGPTGAMMPMNPGASYNAYAAMNPYAGLAARGPYQGAPGLFSPYAPAPPPTYAGQMAQMHPLMPPPASALFNTSYGAGLERQQVRADTNYAQNLAGGGILARIGTDLTAGAAGAALGGRFGGGIGAAIGGIGGFLGSELSSLGRGAQNLFMNQIAAPMLHQRAMTANIEELSRGFISSGPGMHARGAGFSHEASSEVARGIRDMASSESFQRQTGNRFNQQDLFKVTQEAARNDMFTGVQNPEQMTGRVREVAKSLSAFMQLAQEPDIQRAIQTMGQMRASGLNLAETTQAVSQGRTFARMAGQSFSELASQAGAMGSQTFQSMGMTQGLGMQTGMMNYGLARGAQVGGTLNPQLMNLVGNAAGLGNLNNMFSASMLQSPMLAPSVMSASGGMNIGAMQNLLSGNTNAFDQTRAGTGALQSIARAQGPGGLGAAIAMQPMLQDTIGRMLQAQGPFAQRSFENQNIMSTMRQMNLSGSGGFLTMAQTMGMDRSQAMARLQELQDPAYFQRQRDQINVRRREGRQAEIERNEADAPGMLDEMTRLDPTGITGATRRFGRGVKDAYRHLGHIGEETLGIRERYEPTNRELRRDLDRTVGSREMTTALREIESGMQADTGRFASRISADYDINRRLGGGFLSAGLAALVPSSARDRTAAITDMNQMSGLVAGVMTSSRGQEVSAGRTVNQTFGQGREGSDRLMSFSGDVARIMGGTSLLGSESLGAVANIVLPGVGGQAAATQRQLEDAYVNRMRGTGQSETALRQQFQQRAPEITAQASTFSRYLMDPHERERAQNLATSRIVDPSSTGFRAAAQERADTGIRRMFGQEGASSNEARRAANAIFENIAEKGGSYGRNPQERRRAREAMAALSMYRSVANDPTTPDSEKRRAREQQQQLLASVRSQFGDERARDMVRDMERNDYSGTINQNPEQRRQARNFVNAQANARSPEDILHAVATGRTEQEQGEGATRMVDTSTALAAKGGAVGRMMEGISGDQFSMTRLTDRLGGQTNEQIDAMSRQGVSGQRLAQAARLLKSGSEEDRASAAQIIQKAMGGDDAGGDRARRLGAEFRESREGFVGKIRGLFSSQTEQQYVAENLVEGTEADQQANEQLNRVNAEEAAARSAGIGGDNDPMVQAASELREAAQALNRVVQGGALDRAVNPE